MNLIIVAIVGIVSAAFHGIGLLENPPWHIVYSDIVPFFEKAIEPGFPYIGKTIEYPVLTGLFVHLMGVLGGGTEMGYYIATSLFLIACAVGTTYFLARIRQNIRDQKPLLIFWILAPSMLIFMIYNWDMIAIFFTVLGLYMMQRERPYAAAASFACGFASKFYPIIYLAPLLFSCFRKFQKCEDMQKTARHGVFLFSLSPFLLRLWSESSQGALQKKKNPISEPLLLRAFGIVVVFLAVALALNGVFMIANWQNWSYFFTFNRLREANPDSIWTAIQFLTGSLDVSTINIISLILFAASYGIFLWRYRMMNPIFLSFGGTILFLFFNKVFSPQYVLWLLPFFVLMPIKKKWFYSLEFANLAALFSILAWFFLGREALYLWFTIGFVVVRHLALMGVLFNLLHKKTLRWPSEGFFR